LMPNFLAGSLFRGIPLLKAPCSIKHCLVRVHLFFNLRREAQTLARNYGLRCRGWTDVAHQQLD
jgi:hypothetical protein